MFAIPYVRRTVPFARALPTLLVAFTAWGCGSNADEAHTDAAANVVATDSIVGTDATTEDAGPDSAIADGSSADVTDTATANESGADTASETGGDADAGATDVASDAPTDAPPASTWGCAENDNLCDCYDANLTAGYTQPTCVKTYPCCVRFTITKSGMAPYHGCDCYSEAHLTTVGRTCAEQVDRINGIATYSAAVITTTCPSP